MPEFWFLLLLFMFGMCIGSFLNVCIYRIPGSKSIVYPASHCLNCEAPIQWYDNIPVLSYILLKGRCRHCDTRISLRYPLVEGMMGVLAVLFYLKFGWSPEALIYFVFTSILVVISLIDIDHMIIPDIISLPAIPICLLAALILPHMSFTDSIIGLLVGGGSLYLVAEIYYLVKKQEGMGGGDIKLLAMIGALTGWQGVLFTIFIGSAIGTLAGIVIMVSLRAETIRLRIPFGPFLSLGAVLYVFCGPELIRWYLFSL
jgi:leader peptidase (prepilin peptidase)/N-methyltransferase